MPVLSLLSSKGHKPKNMNIFLRSPTGFYINELKHKVCLVISYLIFLLTSLIPLHKYCKTDTDVYIYIYMQSLFSWFKEETTALSSGVPLFQTLSCWDCWAIATLDNQYAWTVVKTGLTYCTLDACFVKMTCLYSLIRNINPLLWTKHMWVWDRK